MRLFAYNKPIGDEIDVRDISVIFPAQPGEEARTEELKAYPVSKLEKEGGGLVIFTDDESQVENLKARLDACEMEYHVDTDGNLNYRVIQAIRAGIELEDGSMSPACRISWTEANAFVINIKPCSDAFLRDITKAAGYNVTLLKKYRAANLKIKKVALGTYEEYSEDEVKAFLA